MNRTGHYRGGSEKRSESKEELKSFIDKLKSDGWKGFKRVELVDEYAEKIGRIIASTNNNKSQVRGFFDEVNAIRAIVEGQEKRGAIDFESVLPAIKLIKAKVAYKAARSAGSRNIVSQEFKQLMFACIDAVQTAEDFKIFAEFFEAMYAYFYGLARGN